MPLDKAKKLLRKDLDDRFDERLNASFDDIKDKFEHIYGFRKGKEWAFESLMQVLLKAYSERPLDLKKRDYERSYLTDLPWFLSNELVGMSLYVDRFSGDLPSLEKRLSYINKLGVNLLHLMPLFESPDHESDGGYAVSDFRKVHQKYGTLKDLKALAKKMRREKVHLMLDIVINHTSHRHEWAEKARKGDKKYQGYFYFFDNKEDYRAFEQAMPEVFPEAAPGNFTYVPELGKWVMTVFHNYQWDLNYTNPMILVEMMEIMLFYAILGVDILRIDAPAFIWKRAGTDCQNLPEVHAILQLMKLCVNVAAPGMALLGEAIVAPEEIMKYFGTGEMTAKECDVAYNATQMALQWDALATQDTSVMMHAQSVLRIKPRGTTWITYTRCHDDIGLAYDDYMISDSGYHPYLHRKFIKEYYTGAFKGSDATGALFSVSEKTGDARISGSLASLCGLESAIKSNDLLAMDKAVKKIALMQAMSFFIGGIPMLFYGDEAAYTNDYSYLDDKGKDYDNRWMHRPLINWKKNALVEKEGSVEHTVFSTTQKLIKVRKEIPVLADKSNITWLTTNNKHVAGFLRAWDQDRVYCLFNFSSLPQTVKNHVFKEHGMAPSELYDYWSEKSFDIHNDFEDFYIAPYEFFILKP